MGPHEERLIAASNAEGDWAAPDLHGLQIALSSLERALGDLSQPNASTWDGAAAQSAAKAFAKMSKKYREVKEALSDANEVVPDANRARERARAMLNDLPSAEVPSWVHGAVDVAQAAGKANVVIGGYAYIADQAVGIFESWLGDKREEQAAQAMRTLEQELEPHQVRVRHSRERIGKAMDLSIELDDGAGTHPTTLDDAEAPTGGYGGPYPVPSVPSVPGPNLGQVPTSTPWPTGTNPSTGLVPQVPPGTGNPTDTPAGFPVAGYPSTQHPGQVGTDPSYPDWPGRGPDVDSGSGGTIGGGGSGFTAGALGGGAIAGAAAMRWGSRAAGAGGAGMGATGAMPGGGLGGLLGTGGTGGAGGAGGAGGMGRASGMAGGAGARGLAGGLAGGGASGSGAAGSGSGAAASAASGGARGGMVAGGAPGGAGAGSSKRQQKPGLGGHIAPKLEDDDEFMPQSDAARAGGREDVGDA